MPLLCGPPLLGPDYRKTELEAPGAADNTLALGITAGGGFG